MSRIGNKLILLPAGVTLTVEGQNNVVVKGPKGELAYQFNANMGIEVNLLLLHFLKLLLH